MREGDLEKADALYRRWAATGRMPIRPEATIGVIRRDSAAIERFVAEARRSTGRAPALGGRDVAVYFEDFGLALRIARAALEGEKPAAARAFAHRTIAELEIGRGRWHDAVGHLDEAVRLDPAGTAEHAALWAALPFLPVSAAERDRFLRHLERAPEQTEPGLIGELAPYGRLYLKGLLHVRRGRRAEAVRCADELARATPGEAGTLVAAMSAALRAEIAAASDSVSAALQQLEEVRGEIPSDLLASPVFGQDLARHTRADLLFGAERFEEALRWFSHGFAGSPSEVVFLAPAALREAEIHERLGNPAAAIRSYARFTRLWQEADAELRPLVEHARGRIRALETAVR